MTRIVWSAALVCAVLACFWGRSFAASAQDEIPAGAPEAEEAPPARQTESALRRFEIVTLTALPFTAAHSYLAVKGYRSLRAGTLAAPVDGGDWNIVVAGAVALSAGIGMYDYFRMRGKDRNESLLPEPPPRPQSTDPDRRRLSAVPFQPPLLSFAARF